ncbi:MAG: NAD+ synthase [Magnetovibrionaceae bacterium]
MVECLRIGIAQTNPHVGDVAGNIERVLSAREALKDCDLIVTSELEVSGYPPEDLVLKKRFLDAVEAGVGRLIEATKDGGPAILVGAPWRDESLNPFQGRAFNAALLLDQGAIRAVRYKHLLPNYSVFDEMRVFERGLLPEPVPFRGVNLGIMVCEDMWSPPVSKHLAEAGADVLIALNGSPFDVSKIESRYAYARNRTAETGLDLLYTNFVGGQDELVFDGGSFIMGADGLRKQQLPWFETKVAEARLEKTTDGWRFMATEPLAEPDPLLENIYQAVQLGLRDYVGKNGFPGVVLGLSGGVDSALSAAIAVDALGPNKVRCVMMPSPYTSQESLDDAAGCGDMLGVSVETINIGPAMEAFETMLAPAFAGKEADITEENIQARARGLTLMALSNKFGHMLLTTGNKSEMSVGYATLYGDMCGGFSVLKDLYKTTVFALCRWRNENKPKGSLGPDGPVMPENVITKPPTAELRDNQKDSDSLPDYDDLDAVLQVLVEDEGSVADALAAGLDEATVRRIWLLLDRAEYKRRQAPPGVKISKRAFGRERRYPLTNGFTLQA